MRGATNATGSPHGGAPMQLAPATNDTVCAPLTEDLRATNASCVELKRYRFDAVGSPRFIAQVQPSPVWKFLQTVELAFIWMKPLSCNPPTTSDGSFGSTQMS